MLINDTYCGEVEQNGPLVGHIPVEGRPVLVLPDVELTAVTVTTAEDQTVAFVGTSDGHLKKVRNQDFATATRLSSAFTDMC
jgi:plexin A